MKRNEVLSMVVEERKKNKEDESFVGSLLIYDNSEKWSKGIETFVETALKDVSKEYEESTVKNVIPRKLYIDSNLFNDLEKKIVSDIKLKKEFDKIPDLQKGWPIIEYASDIFQGLPGEVPKKENHKKLMEDFCKLGWTLVLMIYENPEKSEQEFRKFYNSLNKSACYCGRVKNLTKEFPGVYEKLLFSKLI